MVIFSGNFCGKKIEVDKDDLLLTKNIDAVRKILGYNDIIIVMDRTPYYGYIFGYKKQIVKVIEFDRGDDYIGIQAAWGERLTIINGAWRFATKYERFLYGIGIGEVND